MELFRESIVGQGIRYVTKNKVLLYPEEKPDFHWAPLVRDFRAMICRRLDIYILQDRMLSLEAEKDHRNANGVSHQNSIPSSEEADPVPTEKPYEDAEDSSVGENDQDRREEVEHPIELSRTLTRTSTKPYTRERFDAEQALEVERTKSIVLMPTKTADGTILVEWYTTDDSDNPQNWTLGKKWIVLIQLALYSFAAYGASSMYVSSIEGVREKFHVGSAAGALGLAIYVVGYGVGPLLFAPMSEIPVIGRNLVYGPTFFLFVILGIPLAVVDNYAGLLVLRFLTGFFSSPAVANGGATIGDIVSAFVDMAKGSAANSNSTLSSSSRSISRAGLLPASWARLSVLSLPVSPSKQRAGDGDSGRSSGSQLPSWSSS